MLVVVEETGAYCQVGSTTVYNHLWLFMCLSHLRSISDWRRFTIDQQYKEMFVDDVKGCLKSGKSTAILCLDDYNISLYNMIIRGVNEIELPAELGESIFDEINSIVDAGMTLVLAASAGESKTKIYIPVQAYMRNADGRICNAAAQAVNFLLEDLFAAIVAIGITPTGMCVKKYDLSALTPSETA